MSPTLSIELKHIELCVVHIYGVHELYLATGGHDHDLVRAEVGALEEPELAGLHQTLDGVDTPQDPEVVDHQEPVHGLEVAVSPGEPAGDQVVAVHVKV